jgi:hypothetical protein
MFDNTMYVLIGINIALLLGAMKKPSMSDVLINLIAILCCSLAIAL